jgi:large subunit ribosomal protein LP1
MASNELALVFAALILNDAGAPITGDKLNAILKAAGVAADPAWVNIYANFFKSNDLGALLSSVSFGGGGGAAPGPAESATAVEAAAPAKEEPKKEEEAVVELAGGFDDLFG